MTIAFVTGMFRSGTTTLARALSAHPQVVCAADPMMELFKALRSETAQKLGNPKPFTDPLDDYYFDPVGQRLLRELLTNATFDQKVTVWPFKSRMDQIKARCRVFAGLLVPYMDELAGDTYREVMDSMLEGIRKAYGDADTSIVGLKEVWTTEFIPAMARTYPEARFIVVIRDPRAVCASKNVQSEKYPWSFLASQWRKLASLHYLVQTMPELRGRVLGVRQEDFVLQPVKTTQRLCEFLGIAQEPAMADPGVYMDGDGRPWRQNTAFGDGKKGFDAQALNRWRNVLTKREISLIELMCGGEMALHGYAPDLHKEEIQDEALLLDPPLIQKTERTKWTEGVIDYGIVHTSVKLAQERLRTLLLSLASEERSEISEELVRGSFLDRSVMDAIAGLDEESAAVHEG